MQDLKHLTNRKKSPARSSIFNQASRNSRNRSVRSDGEKRRIISELTPGQKENIKYALIFLAIVIGLTPVTLMLVKRAPQGAAKIAALFKTASVQKVQAAQAPQKQEISDFEAATILLPSAEDREGSLLAAGETGELYKYSIDCALQKRVHDFMATSKVPYSVFVAIEPTTGRILAMTSYSEIDRSWEPASYFNLYPMASLFKIVTATAALESRKLTPASMIEFRGRSYSENPKYWDVSPNGKNNSMDATSAMGKSINPVYGRIAAEIAGKEAVMASVNRFGFNQRFLTGTPAKSSIAAPPSSQRGLMLMGSGLDHDVKISPLHAAVIMAGVANNGVMMNPSLVDAKKIGNSDMKQLFAPKELRRLVAPETADSLKTMLSTTVTTGTSRKAFRRKDGRSVVNVAVAAKTGSINGTDPKGHYSWFAAFAPMEKPEIALVALVINPDKWKIKSAQVGAEALDQFFNRRNGKN